MEVNNSFGPIDISISGLKAYGKSVELIHSNIANSRTTDAGNGQPYRRVEAMLQTSEDGGVEVADVKPDMSEFQQILDPGNPAADANGYLRLPNVDVAREVINLQTATRAYEANVAALKRYQRMVETTLELLK